MSPDPSDTAVDSLSAELDGDVLRPGDAGWDVGRQPWNLIADQRPGLIVHAASAADVARAVSFAADQGMRIAPQGTGHGAARMPDLGGTILLRTAQMNDVVIDPEARLARVGAGSQWADVVGPAAQHGLACLHGSSGTVGVAGYALGGGVGWLARSEGFACNHVVSLEAVTADGETLRIDRENEPELFWALRGGGGGQAVVTELELELFEMETAYGGALMWPIEQATDIAQAWREWTHTVPESLTSTVKVVRFPPFPELPDPIRGRALAVITFAFRGDEAEGGELAAPLRAVADPYLDMVSTIPAPALAEIAGDPKDPVPGRGDGFLLDSLDGAAIDAYVDLVGPEVDVPLIHLEIRHLGGALDRSGDDHGALDVAAGSHLVYGVGAAMSPEADGAIIGTLTGIKERMAPWRADCSQFGFAEMQNGLRGSFPAEVADRIEAAKAKYDPDGLLVGVSD